MNTLGNDSIAARCLTLNSYLIDIDNWYEHNRRLDIIWSIIVVCAGNIWVCSFPNLNNSRSDDVTMRLNYLYVSDKILDWDI